MTIDNNIPIALEAHRKTIFPTSLKRNTKLKWGSRGQQEKIYQNTTDKGGYDERCSDSLSLINSCVNN